MPCDCTIVHLSANDKKSIPHLGATHATTFKLLIPLFATAYSLLFLNEVMTVWIACGMGLVILGIAGMQPERNGDA